MKFYENCNKFVFAFILFKLLTGILEGSSRGSHEIVRIESIRDKKIILCFVEGITMSFVSKILW